MSREGEREAIIETVNAVLAEHGAQRENMIPLLQEVQQRLGYLPQVAMEELAAALGIAAVDVYGPATFYNNFRLHPPGDNEIKVCMGTACYMIGGQIALDSFERRLAIKPGETTPDRKFSLDQVACVGCCALAPVVVVNNYVEGRVTPTRVDGIILSFAEGNNKGTEKETKEGTEKEKGNDE